MNVSTLVWAITIGFIVALFVFDFYVSVRDPHEPTFKESASWSVFYIAIAVGFGVFVMLRYGGQFGGEYFAGYITEKALSVDNLFVFVIIMSAFAIPRMYQQKVLLIGIAMALVMRAIFIAVGAAAINAYSWVFYLFGAFLIYTAYGLVAGKGHGGESAGDNRIITLARKYLPTTEEYHGDKLTVRISGKRFVTPMFLALIAIGITDLIFALDSIPAIYGLTEQAYIVFAANAFALMGLRQLFFLLDGLLDRLVYLSYGLSLILAFIGVKLIIHALEKNELSFINNGRPVETIKITTGMSLTVIISILVVTTVASLIKTGGFSGGAKAEPVETDTRP